MRDKMTVCKTCGEPIAQSAKVCPYCGAKNRKSILTKWWFWIAVLVVLLIVAGASGDGSTTKDKVSTPVEVAAVEDEAPKGTKAQKSAIVTEQEPAESMTTGQKNALRAAKRYIDFKGFSYDGLIKQLEFEKYTHEDATFAADNCGADWNEQALRAAKSYLDLKGFSHDGLIKQLEYEKYTTEQATYAADNCGADWNEQAARSAKSYLEFTSFSKDGLIHQLEFEGFTHEQAVYGAEQNGY